VPTDITCESGSEEWGTPEDFFKAIAWVWGPFDLDPCCTPANAKAKRYFTKEADGLKQQWFGRVFVNPPFNRKKKMYVGPWVQKAEAERNNCKAIVMLLPARTGTKWWQEIVMPAAHKIFFVKGRLKFVQEGKDSAATFPSAIVIFLPEGEGYNRPEFDIWDKTR
jgi:phage N-6-adenine-methyltransferase